MLAQRLQIAARSGRSKIAGPNRFDQLRVEIESAAEPRLQIALALRKSEDEQRWKNDRHSKSRCEWRQDELIEQGVNRECDDKAGNGQNQRLRLATLIENFRDHRGESCR